MEFYAKSKDRILGEEEKRKRIEKLQKFKSLLEWEAWELRFFGQLEKEIRENKQTTQKKLSEHLQETVNCAEHFFRQYGNYFTQEQKELVLEACRLHDIGKINLVFQSMVNDELKKTFIDKQAQIPHGYLSAISIKKDEIFEKYPEWSKDHFSILLTAIYYHHTREDEFTDDIVKSYCKQYYEVYVREYFGIDQFQVTLRNRNELLFAIGNQGTVTCEESIFQQYQLVKGLLNKFDWTVSAGYQEAEQNLDLHKKQLVGSIERKFGTNLKPAQQFMKLHREENVVVVAPTGSGKTEAALLWLNGEKGFYTLPLIVSSNAIYERIKTVYDYRDVELVHSGSFLKYLESFSDEEENAYEKYQKAKLLSGPLTVCTVDQLFKFVYGALGTEIFAATLKYSKVILDEIQAYQPRVVAALIYGLKTIHELGGRFAIITATFPPVLQMFMKKYGLLEGKAYQLYDCSSESILERHKVSLRDDEINIEEIAEKGRDKKVLVICNTVKRAQEIYKKLSVETEEVYILHAKILTGQRREQEKRIMEFSNNPNASGIWVTTQIVEASLDIDFDLLYTEMCIVDSLLQRMGRCNRSGRYIPNESNIIVFLTGNGVGTVYEKDLYERSVQYLEKYKEIMFTEELKVKYINGVYNPKEIENTGYYKKIQEHLEHFSNIRPAEYTQQETNEKFRDILSVLIMPEEIYNDNMELIQSSIEILKNRFTNSKLKALVNSKLNDLTLSINRVRGRLPEGIDRNAIPGTSIHRARFKYEFDDQGRGAGLLSEERIEDCFFW